jgi:hypothetical protein
MCRKFHLLAAAIGALGITGLAGVTISSAGAQSRQAPSCMSADFLGLAPLAASTVALGAYTGVAYYTVEATGYQVVATLLPSEAGAPIRFIATLADGQNAILSVPQAVGMPALEVEFHRCGSAMVVRSSASPPPAMAVVE